MSEQRRVVAVPDPPAGGGFTFPIGGAVEVEVQAVSFLFTASANVASRLPRLDFVDSAGRVFYRAEPSFTVTANNSVHVSFGVNAAQFGANNGPSMGAPIPSLRLYNGLAVVGTADLINVTDTITEVVLFVKQWPVREDERF